MQTRVCIGGSLKLDLKKLKIGEAQTIQVKKDEVLRHSIESADQLVALLKKLRKKKGKTQEDIARYANLSRLAVGEFENAKTDIKLSTLFKMLKACGLGLEIRE